MASRQRLDKKAMSAQVKARPGYKQQAGMVGVPAHNISTNKPPHAYSMVIPTHAMPTGKYPFAAGNMHVPAHVLPVNKHPIMNVPVHTALKSKQQIPNQHTAPSMTPKINQSPLDVTLPSSHSFWRLRPHPSLDFDAHRQKIVSKKNQVAVSRRYLSPYIQWKKNEQFAVADVIEVPPELFQLKDLNDIVNVEAWKGCLSPSERRFLRGLLPEGADYGSLVRALTRGDNFCFGNPLADWGKLLLKGELNPDFVQQKEHELKLAHEDHYQEVQRYHDKMLETLRLLKEEWILCKSAEKRLGSRSRRRKARALDSVAANDYATEGTASRPKGKRQKVKRFQQASGRIDLQLAKDSQSSKNRLDKNAHYDDCTQSMHTLKVTRTQYADILDLMKGKGDELSVAALSCVLNHQQKIEIDCARGCDEADALKVQKCWSKLVEDIPAAHVVFSQRKSDKERLAMSAVEQCLQYYSVFMCKENELDVQSNSNAILPLEPKKLVPESQRSIKPDRRNSSASESSVTCLEEQVGTQAAVESCLSSVDCSGDILPQHLIQEEQISLIDLPSGSSLVGEGHATLLSVVQPEREQQSCGNGHSLDLHKRSSMDIRSAGVLETDTFSECNEGSVTKHSQTNQNVHVQEIKSNDIDLGNWELHSKLGSEVFSAAAAAASGESEEVEQRVVHQSGGNVCNGSDNQLFCWSGPSNLLAQEEPTEKGPLCCANYTSSTKKHKDTQDQVTHHENYQNVNADGIVQGSASSMEEFAQSEDVCAKEYKRVFETDQNQVDSEQNKKTMLHLFLDQKSRSSEFVTAEVSSSLDLEGKNDFCEATEAIPLVSRCDDEDILKEHEPITELSLLVDDRSAKQNFLTEQADSVSSRTEAEFVLHDSMEPHWMLRHNKQDAQVYPFQQNLRELNLVAQPTQDAYSPHSFTPMAPVWSNPQQLSHLNFTNHWNVDAGADQTNWISAETAVAPFFPSSKDEGGRPSSVSHYWDQVPRGPCINSWSTKQDQSAAFIRRAIPDLQDEQVYQAPDNWGPMHSQPLNHLTYMWAADRSGRVGSHPWKNASLFSHLSPQCEQQKVQNTCLSKMNPNFTATWH